MSAHGASDCEKIETPNKAKPRLVVLDRKQVRWGQIDVEALIALDHPARAIWALMESLDLQEFEKGCGSRGERAGRPSWSPQVLISIWVYAYSQGMASAQGSSCLDPIPRAHALGWRLSSYRAPNRKKWHWVSNLPHISGLCAGSV